MPWIGTAQCCADTPTKILGREASLAHAQALGFIEIEGPEAFQLEVGKKPVKTSQLKLKPNTRQFAVNHVQQSCDQLHSSIFGWLGVENESIEAVRKIIRSCQIDQVAAVIFDICISGKTGFVQVVQKLPRLRVVSITKEMSIQVVGSATAREAQRLQLTKPCLAWFFPPCTGGSPVLNLIEEIRRTEIQLQHWKEFCEIVQSAKPLLSVCFFKAVKMSVACTYWRTEIMTNMIQELELRIRCNIHRCSYSSQHTEPVPKHTYRVMSNVAMFQNLRECQCQLHSSLNHQNLEEQRNYPFELALKLSGNFMKLVS